jgi:hypothetical protein
MIYISYTYFVITGISNMQVSKRVVATDPPVIVMTKKLMAGAKDVKSLAQGWAPLTLSADHTGPFDQTTYP